MAGSGWRSNAQDAENSCPNRREKETRISIAAYRALVDEDSRGVPLLNGEGLNISTMWVLPMLVKVFCERQGTLS